MSRHAVAASQKTGNLLTSALNAPLAPGAGGLVAYGQNAGSSTAAGGEIGLKGTSESGIHWNTNYALVSIADKISFNPLSGGTSVLDYAHGTPTSMVNIGTGYNWDRFELDTQAHWQSHFTDVTQISALGSQPSRIADYFTMSARIGYRVTDEVTLALAGQQLIQPHIPEAAGVPIERRITVTLKAAF